MGIPTLTDSNVPTGAPFSSADVGKWHLSNAYRTPANPASTAKALEPNGFTEFND
jgi:arylsulfatase